MEEILNINVVGNKVLQALSRFLEQDFELLEIDANERTLTHRVAIYLQELFPDMNVDCEYHRDGHDPKEMFLPGGGGDEYDTDAQTVNPDIIFHKRRARENLLVIEFKKTSSRVNDRKDFLKLHEYKRQLHYQYAIFVEFEVGSLSCGINRIEWLDE